MYSDAATVEPGFVFIGENLSLDFANTFFGFPPDMSQERLVSYAHLVAWSELVRLVDRDEAQQLLRKAERSPVEAAAVLDRARVLREAIRGIVLAQTHGTPPTQIDLDLLNSELEQAMCGTRLVMTADGFDWAWREDQDALDRMLGPVARAAAQLFTSAERQYMRKCAHDACHWLFVDTTKNHSRQWCRTAGCGNVIRVRKHRERQSNQDKSATDL